MHISLFAAWLAMHEACAWAVYMTNIRLNNTYLLLSVDDESFVAAQAEWDAIATVEIAERSDTGVDGIPCSVTQQVILPEVTVESVIEHFRWDDKLPHFKVYSNSR